MTNFLKSQKFIGLVIFLLMFIISHRYWFFESDIILGHNWDYTFPGIDSIAERVKNVSNYMWSDYSDATLLLQSHIVHNNLFSLFSKWFGVAITIKVLFFIVMLVSYISMRLLISNLTKLDDHIITFSALIYTFSPYMFSIFIGGSWYAWLSYAFSPLLVFSIINIVLNGRINKYHILFLSQVFVIGFPQFFLIVNLIAISYIFYYVRMDIKNIALYAKRYFFIVLFLILVNTYWIAPFLWHISSFQSEVFNNQLITSFGAIFNSTQTADNIFNLTGFNNRNLYFFSLNDIEGNFYNLSIYLIWSGIIYSFINNSNYTISRHNLIVFLSLFAIFFILALSASGTLGWLTIWIYESIPFMKIYRNPQNIFMSIAFLFPILLALSYASINTNHKKIYKHFLSFLIPVLFIGWVINGDIGTLRLKSAQRDHIDYYKISPDISQMWKKYNERDLVSRSLFIPNTNSPFFNQTEYQGIGQGGVPEYNYTDGMPFFPKRKGQEYLNESLMNGDVDPELINGKSIRYITIRSDLKHFFWPTSSNYSRIVEREVNQKLKSVSNGDYYSTFMISDNDYHPLITLLEGNTNSSDTILEYKKVSPVKFKVRIRNINIDSVYLLNFSQTFNKSWKILPDSQVDILDNALTSLQGKSYIIKDSNVNDQANSSDLDKYLRDKYIYIDQSIDSVGFVSKIFNGSIQNDNIIDYKKIEISPSYIPESYHYKVSDKYGSSNIFIIDMDYFLKVHKKSVVESDNRFDLFLTIEFETQRVFYYGSLFSVLMLLTYFSYIYIYLSRRKLPKI
jgi:hypothetical protein